MLRITKFHRLKYFLLFISSFLVKPANFAPASPSQNLSGSISPRLTSFWGFSAIPDSPVTSVWAHFKSKFNLGPDQPFSSRFLKVKGRFLLFFDTEFDVNVINE